jgi:hypothetical protein
VSSQAFKENPFFQVTWMLSINFGTVRFQTPQVKNFWNCSTKMNSKFQRHNAPLIIPLLEMVTYYTLWSIWISNCQMWPFLISWTQITCQ